LSFRSRACRLCGHMTFLLNNLLFLFVCLFSEYCLFLSPGQWHRTFFFALTPRAPSKSPPNVPTPPNSSHSLTWSAWYALFDNTDLSSVFNFFFSTDKTVFGCLPFQTQNCSFFLVPPVTSYASFFFFFTEGCTPSLS